MLALQQYVENPGPEVILPFSHSTYLSMKCALVTNVKMPKTVGILKFITRKIALSFVLSKKMASFMNVFLIFMKITSLMHM